MQTIEEDFIEDLLMTTNHHYIMFFTNTGRCYRLRPMRSRRPEERPGAQPLSIFSSCSREKGTATIPMKEIDNENI